MQMLAHMAIIGLIFIPTIFGLWVTYQEWVRGHRAARLRARAAQRAAVAAVTEDRLARSQDAGWLAQLQDAGELARARQVNAELRYAEMQANQEGTAC